MKKPRPQPPTPILTENQLALLKGMGAEAVKLDGRRSRAADNLVPHGYVKKLAGVGNYKRTALGAKRAGGAV